MNESFYVPVEAVNELEKFVSKAKKNMPQIQISIGDEESKVFHHLEMGMDGVVRRVKLFHNVCKVDLSYPDENNFKLLAKIEDGMFFPMNFGKQVAFPEGKDENYCYCDVCGRKTPAFRYVLKNTETGEVFFVGKECTKKFGVKTLDTIYGFTKKLHEFFDTYGCGLCDDAWMGGCGYKEDRRQEMMAMQPRRVLASAYHYYTNTSKEWKKGYYDGDRYWPSESMADIKDLIFKKEDERPTIDDKMFDTFMSFGVKKFKDKESEFSQSIYAFCTNFYAKAADACYAFFIVKSYFDSIKEKPSVNKGDYIKLDGVIIYKGYDTDWRYGSYPVCHIKAVRFDVKLIRFGVVNGAVGDEVSGYAMVKSVSKSGDIYLGRVTKNPKKGIEYKTL